MNPNAVHVAGAIRRRSRALARHALSAARRPRQGRAPTPAPGPAPAAGGARKRPARPPVVGVVEQFSKRLVVGWVSVPPGTEPLKVTLHLGTFQAAATYATPSPTLSGSQEMRRASQAPGRPSDPQPGGPPVHPWQAPDIPGPRGDRRNSRQQIRTFSFRVREIWPYLGKKTRVTVRVDGRPLPISGHGMFLSPPTRGKKSLAELRAKFEEGYLFSQYGRLQLSKKLDSDWQQQVMDLYTRCRKLVEERFGYDLFFVYGTLLGAVREGGYIGHDVDFDAAYLARHTDGRAAARELRDIGLSLIEDGLDVRLVTTALHIHDPKHPDAGIDIFHIYFDEADELQFPFGVAGDTVVRRADWRGTTDVPFPGGTGRVPVNAEQVVEQIYGADWRQPKPGFNWKLDRTRADPMGATTTELQSEVYWANFYARKDYASGSTFCDFVNKRPRIPGSVMDIGCGDGRDARAFGAAGKTVLGVDQSHVGVEHARQQAMRAGLAGKVAFEVCDVSDAERFRSLLAERRTAVGGPVLFYLRFFLHSIPEEVQETLLGVLAEQAQDGDVLAAEFRTDKDAERTKVHGKHYRRFQSGDEFGKRLYERYGFVVEHEEEGTGLSPYQDEDPVLYRVIARR
jgi:SAM-dependent methyltransferase